MSKQKKRSPQPKKSERLPAKVEPEKTGPCEEDLSSEDSGDAGAEDLQIRILPLWAWALVVIVSFLIAFWLVSTYVLGAL